MLVPVSKIPRILPSARCRIHRTDRLTLLTDNPIIPEHATSRNRSFFISPQLDVALRDLPGSMFLVEHADKLDDRIILVHSPIVDNPEGDILKSQSLQTAEYSPRGIAGVNTTVEYEYFVMAMAPQTTAVLTERLSTQFAPFGIRVQEIDSRPLTRILLAPRPHESHPHGPRTAVDQY